MYRFDVEELAELIYWYYEGRHDARRILKKVLEWTADEQQAVLFSLYRRMERPVQPYVVS